MKNLNKYNSFKIHRKFVLIFSSIILILLSVFYLLSRAFFNNCLKVETINLLGAKDSMYQRLKDEYSKANTHIIKEGGGTYVLIDKQIDINGEKYYIEIGKSNTLFGPGILAITSDNKFVLIKSDGNVYLLNIPKTDSVWWKLFYSPP